MIVMTGFLGRNTFAVTCPFQAFIIEMHFTL